MRGAALLAAALLGALVAGPVAAAELTLVSHATAGPSTGGNGLSLPDALSVNGQVVLFTSSAADLIPGFLDRNGADVPDVYLFDRGTGVVTLVSHAATGATAGGNGDSRGVALSADGRMVLFWSVATDLVSGAVKGSAGRTDAYLFDRGTGAVTLVSHATTGATTRGNDASFPIALSADGQVVLFRSAASDLVPGFVDGDWPGNPDAYLYDRGTGAVTLVSRAVGTVSTGGYGYSIPTALSADGRVVLFSSAATNLVPGFLDRNGAGIPDVYVYERGRETVTLVSRAVGTVSESGNRGSSPVALSADGMVVLFVSGATDLVPDFVDGNGPSEPDVYLYDRATGAVTLVSRATAGVTTGGNGVSSPISLSANGMVVQFESRATDLVPGFVDGNGPVSGDVFLFDRAKRTTRLLSHAAAAEARSGEEASFGVGFEALSVDGRVAVFGSRATTLVPGFVDGNGASRADAFVWTAPLRSREASPPGLLPRGEAVGGLVWPR